MNPIIEKLDEQKTIITGVAKRFEVAATAIKFAGQGIYEWNGKINDCLNDPKVVQEQTSDAFRLKFQIMCQLIKSVATMVYMTSHMMERAAEDAERETAEKLQEGYGQHLQVLVKIAMQAIDASGVEGADLEDMQEQLEEANEHAPAIVEDLYDCPDYARDLQVEQVCLYIALCRSLTDLLEMRAQAIVLRQSYTEEDDALMHSIAVEYNDFIQRAAVCSNDLRQEAQQQVQAPPAEEGRGFRPLRSTRQGVRPAKVTLH